MSTAPDEMIQLLDTALQEHLSDCIHPDEVGGYEIDSRQAATIVVDTLLGNPQVLHALAATIPDATAAATRPVLSRRETQIVTLVALGLSNRDIAGRLEISPLTVASFLRRVFAKLGVNSRAAMVGTAKDWGLLPTAQPGIAAGHVPDEPRKIGYATGLVYCTRCGYLLSSDDKGLTSRAGSRCVPPPVRPRTEDPDPPGAEGG